MSNFDRVFFSTLLELKNTMDKVGMILLYYDDARNDDKILIYRYWDVVDRGKGHLRDILPSLTSPETIRRCRQKIQSDGLLLPTRPGVLKRRRIRQEAFREWAVKGDKL